MTLRGGTALSGDEDVVATDGGGRWEIIYEGIELVTADQVRLWEAWSGYLAGGVSECLVPLLSWATGPRPRVARRGSRPSGLYVDDDEWPTEMRYGVSDHEAHFSVAADLRATQVSLVVDKGPAIKSGHFFGVGDRAHKVIRPLGGDLFSITPPTRAAIVVDTPAVFDFPLVKAKMHPDDQPSPSLFTSKSGTVSVRFVEAR